MVVLLRSSVVGNPIAVDDELCFEEYQYVVSSKVIDEA